MLQFSVGRCNVGHAGNYRGNAGQAALDKSQTCPDRSCMFSCLIQGREFCGAKIWIIKMGGKMLRVADINRELLTSH